MKLRALVEQMTAQHFVDEDGQQIRFELLPPLTPTELLALEAQTPCPLPSEVRELLSATRGFAQSPLESIDVAGVCAQPGRLVSLH